MHLIQNFKKFLFIYIRSWKLYEKQLWPSRHSGNSQQEKAKNRNFGPIQESSRFSWQSTISFLAYRFRAGLCQHLAKCAFLVCGQKKTISHPPPGVPHPWSPGQGARVQTQYSHGEGVLWWGDLFYKTLPTGRRAIWEFHKSTQDFRHPTESCQSTPRCRPVITVGKRLFQRRIKDQNALPDCSVQLQHQESRDGREQLHQVRKRGLCNIQPYYPAGVSDTWLVSCHFMQNYRIKMKIGSSFLLSVVHLQLKQPRLSSRTPIQRFINSICPGRPVRHPRSVVSLAFWLMEWEMVFLTNWFGLWQTVFYFWVIFCRQIVFWVKADV